MFTELCFVDELIAHLVPFFFFIFIFFNFLNTSLQKKIEWPLFRILILKNLKDCMVSLVQEKTEIGCPAITLANYYL